MIAHESMSELIVVFVSFSHNRQLLNVQPTIKPDHPLYNYKYAETDVWTCEEIQSYYDALLKYDKDFSTISKQVS